MLRWRLLGAAAILIPLLLLVFADYAWNFGYPGIWLFLPALVARSSGDGRSALAVEIAQPSPGAAGWFTAA